MYEELSSSLGTKKADKVFTYLHSDEFKNSFGDWTVHSQSIGAVDPLLAKFGSFHRNDIIDKNGELKFNKVTDPGLAYKVKGKDVAKMILKNHIESSIKPTIKLNDLLSQSTDLNSLMDTLDRYNVEELVNNDITPSEFVQKVNKAVSPFSTAVSKAVAAPYSPVLNSIKDPTVKKLVMRHMKVKETSYNGPIGKSIKLGSPAATSRMSTVDRIRSKFKVKFSDTPLVNEDGEYLELDPFLGIPVKTHEYLDEKGERIKTSVTAVKKDYAEYDFDSDLVFLQRLNNRAEYKTLLTYMNSMPNAELIKNDLIQNASNNRGDLFFAKYPKFKEDALLAAKAEEFINEVLKLKTKWAAISAAGTKTHRIVEAVLKEEKDRNNEDNEILKALELQEEEANEARAVYEKLLNDDSSVLFGIDMFSEDSPIYLFKLMSRAVEEGTITQQDLEEVKQTMNYTVRNHIKEKYPTFEEFTSGFSKMTTKAISNLFYGLENGIRKTEAFRKLAQREEELYKAANPKDKAKYRQEHINWRNAKIAVYPRLENASSKYSNEDDQQRKGAIYYYSNIPGYSSMTIEQKAEAEKKWNEENKELRYVGQFILNNLKPYTKTLDQSNFVKDIQAFKEHVQKRGGRILTEVIVNSNKLLSTDGTRSMRVAGQIDILVIYEDEEGVDPDFRGTVEIYDIKTGSRKYKDEKGVHGVNQGFGQDPYVVDGQTVVPSKLSGYAFQMLLYKRILEEELGLKVKDCFLIPLHTPWVNTTDLDYDAIQMQKFSRTLRDEKQFPGTINIKEIQTVKGEQLGKDVNDNPIYAPSILGYSDLEKRALDRIPELDNETTENKKKQQKKSEGDKLRVQINKARKESELNSILEEIQRTTVKKLDRVRRSKTSREQKERMQTFENDIKELKDLQKIVRFIQEAQENIKGIDDPKTGLKLEGLEKAFIRILNNHLDPEANVDISETIQRLDEIRMELSDYSILKDIKKAIDNLSNAAAKKTIQEQKEYKQLENLIATVEELEQQFYDHAGRLMAKKLVTYASHNAESAMKNHLNAAVKRLKQKKADLESKLAKEQDAGKKQVLAKKIQNLENRIQREYNKIKQFAVDEDAIVEAFRRLPRDVSLTGRMLHSPGSSSDMIISLFSKMIKFQVYKSDQEIHDMMLDTQFLMEEVAEQLDKKTRGLTDTPKKFYEPITETRNKFFLEQSIEGETVGVIKPVVCLVSPFGDSITVEQNGQKLGLDYIEAQKYYRFKLASTKGTAEFRAVKEEYDAFKQKHLEQPYKKEYYEAMNSMDPEAKAEVDKINEAINDIIREEGVSIYFLEGAAALKVKKLQVKRKQLRSEFDEYGVQKTGKALRIAKAIQAHNQKMAKFRDYSINHSEFEKRRSEAKQLYAETPSKYHEWLVNNQKIVTTEKFKTEASAYDSMSRMHKFFEMLEYFEEEGDAILAGGSANAGAMINKIITTHFGSREVMQKFKDFHRKSTVASFGKENGFANLKNLYEQNDLNKIAFIKASAELLQVFSAANSQIGDYYNELYEISNSYKFGDKYDITAMPEAVYNKIIELENKIDEAIATSKAEQQAGSAEGKINSFIPSNFVFRKGDSAEVIAKKKEQVNRYFKALRSDNIWQDEHDSLVEIVPTREYYIELERQRLKHEAQYGNNIPFESSEWFQLNHGTRKGVENAPRAIWTRKLPRKRKYKINSYYEFRKAQELEKIKQSMTLTKQEGLEKRAMIKFMDSAFYKQYHTSSNQFNEMGKALFLEPDADGTYIENKPGENFFNTSVKDEFVRPREEVYDKRGRLKAKNGITPNAKYQKLMSDSSLVPMKKIYEHSLKVMNDAKSKIPEFYDRDYSLPTLRKSTKEGLLESGNGTGKAKTAWNNFKDNFSAVDDVDEVTGAKGATETDIDRKFVPMQMAGYIDPKEQSYDVLAAVTQYFKHASRHRALNDIAGASRTTLALTTKRDLEGEGVVYSNTLGEPQLDYLAKRAGLEGKLLAKKGVESNQTKFLKDIIEMQVFNEINIPVEYSFTGKDGETKTFRFDKLTDTIMGVSSFLQIGGVATIPGILKGIANTLQGSVGTLIETAAGDYVDASAKNFMMRSLQNGKDLGAMISDFGKATGTTKASQLFNHYDAMQGDFFDAAGNKVSSSMVSKLISTDTWFFNQYGGEIVISNMLMNGMLHSLRVDDKGNVYSKKDYRSKVALEKGHVLKDSNGKPKLDEEGNQVGDWGMLSHKEIVEADKKWSEIKKNLYDSISIDPKTKKVKIEEGIKWTLGSPRDMKLKSQMHAVSEKINGAYAKLNKSAIQRTFYGRMLTMYRKYLLPGVRRRYGALQVDNELDDINYGYFRSSFKLLWQERYGMHRLLTAAITGKDNAFGQDVHLSDKERKNLKRAAIETAVLIGLTMLGMSIFLGKGDDEKEEDMSHLRKVALYEIIRLRKETSAMIPSPTVLNDNWKILGSTSAMFGSVDKVLQVIAQLVTNPTETYKSDPAGPWEAGDLKVTKKAWKMLGNSANTVDEMYKYMNNNNY